MKHLEKKYLKFTTSFLIAVYSFSLITAIFHYHNIEFSSNEEFVLAKKENSNHFQIIFDRNYECIVQHNLVNLQTSLLQTFHEFQIVHSVKIYYNSFSCDFCVNGILCKDNPLRAPPFAS